MSLPQVSKIVGQNEDINSVSNKRIKKQILSLFSDVRLKGNISIPNFGLKQIKVYFLMLSEALYIQFCQNFPESAPNIKFDDKQMTQFFIYSETLEKWSSESKLADVLAEIYDHIKNYFHSQQNFLKSSQNFDNLQQIKQTNKQIVGSKKKIKMNGCTDTELTQTKNLNRHFRSKLRQVYNDLMKTTPTGQIPQQAQSIEDCFNLPRVGFEDIAHLLKNEWFNKEVCQQMENGRFMHKIMKGMMSIRSKKLMVKYYHVMLAAAKQPDNFIKWKYP